MKNQVFVKRVWMPDGNIVSANLVYRRKPVLILESGEELIDDNHEIVYEITDEVIVDEKGETKSRLLERPIRVYLTQKLVRIKKYSRFEREDPQDIYPHSSNEWYGRYIRGTEDTIYIVQEIEGSDKIWLTIVDQSNSTIYQSHTINPYELDMLRLKTSYDYFYEMASAFISSDSESLKQEILQILDTETLSWSAIKKLTGGQITQSFKRGKTARETLNRLVNIDKYPIDTHDEILAFLAWVANEKMPDYDITDFVSNANALPTFQRLISHHFKFILDGITPPPYVLLINEIASKIKSDMALEESDIKEPSAALSRKIGFLAPDWQSEIVDITKSLSESDDIVTVIPLPEIKSDRKKQSQKKRYVIAQWGLRLRSHVVIPRAIGLRSLLYIGRAHRWPTRHLAFSARLGPLDQKAPYIQYMTMPPAAAEKVKRALPTTSIIDMDILKINPHLYDKKRKIWTTRTNPILKSISKSVSPEAIRKEFSSWKGNEVHSLTKEEARIIDMSALHFYLIDLAYKSGREYWKTDPESSKRILSSLQKSGIIDISYWFQFRRSLSKIVIMTVEGSKGQVCSLSRAMVKQCPTSRAIISEDAKNAVIMSRISDSTIDFFINTLPLHAKEAELQIKSYIPSMFRNYAAGLLQGLLIDDGKWNDDVSLFLSQIRSLPR